MRRKVRLRAAFSQLPLLASRRARPRAQQQQQQQQPQPGGPVLLRWLASCLVRRECSRRFAWREILLGRSRGYSSSRGKQGRQLGSRDGYSVAKQRRPPRAPRGGRRLGPSSRRVVRPVLLDVGPEGRPAQGNRGRNQPESVTSILTVSSTLSCLVVSPASHLAALVPGPLPPALLFTCPGAHLGDPASSNSPLYLAPSSISSCRVPVGSAALGRQLVSRPRLPFSPPDAEFDSPLDQHPVTSLGRRRPTGDAPDIVGD